MSDCSKQIRSFVLGIIAWGIVTILLKMMKKSEAFTLGDEMQPTNGDLDIKWNVFEPKDEGDFGSPIPGWGKKGEIKTQIDTGSDLDSASNLLIKIGESTNAALTQIESALTRYKEKRQFATDDISDRIDEDREHAQQMITALDKALHDAGRAIRDRRESINAIATKIQEMARTGSGEWDKIRSVLHTGVNHPTAAHTTSPAGQDFTQPLSEGFRQKRRYSKSGPSPTIAGTSLGN
uniref:Uncharacterized protein n=1 Tax=viral metagenome TaxID=1070528 RepID=A0A6C0FBT5_9ZZZZ